MRKSLQRSGIMLAGLMLATGAGAAEGGKKDADGRKVIALIAGPDSHGYGMHEHYAGMKLAGGLLNENVPGVKAEVFKEWPVASNALEHVAAIIVFADGGGGNILLAHMKELEPLMKRGVGLGVIHWALEAPKGEEGDRMLDWIGGYFECNWSVNPFWTARFETLPEHPVTRGVRPFSIHDEWYYHIRFPEKMDGVTPILTDVPPDEAHDGGDSPYGGNATVRARKGMPEHVMWVCQRPGGGRGFGFTGVHAHGNWAQDDFRKLLLNAMVWIAGAEVPENGVKSQTPTLAELEKLILKKR